MITKEELHSSLMEMLKKECTNAKGTKKQTELTDPVFATDSVKKYINSLEGYTSWGALPSTSVSNICSQFSKIAEHGERLGFIDTAIMFKKGKVGVLFSEGGIAVRTQLDSSDNSLSYYQLCTSLISSDGGYIFADNKFSVSDDLIPVISPAKLMRERMTEIRNRLLSSSKTAADAFCNKYLSTLDKVLSLVNEDKLNEAENLSISLCAFAESNTRDTYTVPYTLLISILMLSGKYDKALETANEQKLGEWCIIINNKHNEFKQIKSKEYYEKALAAYNADDCEGALSNIKSALNEWSTVESWSMYLNIVDKFANDDNMFLKDEYNRVMILNSSSPDEQKEVLECNKEKAENLKARFDKFYSNLSALIVKKVEEEDVDFFSKDDRANLMVDKYGMNALMYAAIYKKYDFIKKLMPITDDLEKKNIIEHTYTDILIFCSPNQDTYEKNAYYTDKWYRSEYDYMQNKISSADTKSSFVNSLGNTAMKYGNFDAAYSAEQYKSSLNDDKDYARSSFREKVTHKYDSTHKKTWTDVLQYSFNDTDPAKEKRPSATSRKDQKEYENQKKAFLENYVEKFLTERGEFETTAKYNERKQLILSQGEEAFKAEYKKINSPAKDNIITQNDPQLCRELSSIYLSKLFVVCATLGKYDADKESFEFTWKGFWETFNGKISVPIDIAPEFKKNFCDDGIDMNTENIYIDKNGVHADCSFEFNGQRFTAIVTQKNSNEFKDMIKAQNKKG